MDLGRVTAIIIDDEPDAINLLALYLRRYPNVLITGTSTQAKKGLNMVEINRPDLVFLDIDMPEMNGLELAESICSGDIKTEIVFTTAHQQYAYDALGLEPLDFLTKPYSVEDIEIVLEKYQSRVEKKIRDEKLEKFVQSISALPNLKLPANNGYVVVDVKDIVSIQGIGKKSAICLCDGTKEMVNLSRNQICDLLNPSVFFRLNRSFVVNLNYLVSFNKKSGKGVLGYNNQNHGISIARGPMTALEKLDFSGLTETN